VPNAKIAGSAAARPLTSTIAARASGLFGHARARPAERTAEQQIAKSGIFDAPRNRAVVGDDGLEPPTLSV
jgi:hypothetical protein